MLLFIEHDAVMATAAARKALADFVGHRPGINLALFHTAGHNVCSFEEHAAIVDAMAGGGGDERDVALMDLHLEDAELKLHRKPEDCEVDLLSLFKPG